MMKEALAEFKHKICSYTPKADAAAEDIRQFAAGCTVALAAGGQGKRLKAVSGGTHKTAMRLPDGDTMIERTIRMYKAAGVTDFVTLIYADKEGILEVLGHGEKLGVTIKYSEDPGRPVGRGGAIHNALKNGSIPPDHNLIVANPDDQIISFDGSFPEHIIGKHLEGARRGALMTPVLVEGTPYTFTGMKVADNYITETAMYPVIPLPTHIGVTVISSSVYPLFEELFPLDQKIDFESVIFPRLAREGTLYSAIIPGGSWLSVNDPKSWDKLCELVKAEGAAT